MVSIQVGSMMISTSPTEKVEMKGQTSSRKTSIGQARLFRIVAQHVELSLARVAEAGEPRRIYVTSTTRIRLHQRSFRERVIEAYRATCSLCRLRHRELLDAAHIIPDPEEAGLPSITNGIALCKLHHSAFDSFMIGISPDYEIKIRDDILVEENGPMLVHGLQGLHGQRIHLPPRQEQWPSRDSRAWRYEQLLNH